MIRQLNSDDSKAIHQLFLEAYNGHWQWSEMEISQSFNKNYYYYWGVYCDQQLIGVAQLTLLFNEAELINIAILPTHQQHGLGKQLLQAALEQLKQQGMTQCLLEVREYNQPAKVLYEKLGFIKIDQRSHYYTDTQEAADIYQWKGNDDDKNFSH